MVPSLADSYRTTVVNRVDIRTAINEKKAFGLIDCAKHASDSKSDQAPQLKEDSDFDQALEFKEDTEFDQALEFKKDQFQNITKDGNYVVYNAYVDGPEKGWIRAIGFSSQRKPTVSLQCLFWDANINAVCKTTNVNIQILPFHTSERFKNAIFLCPIPVENASGVTIVQTGTSGRQPPNVMKIRESRKANRTFTICLRPIHFRDTVAYDIVEWVEYCRLMGVDYFMIYNFTSDPLTDKILNYYVNSGIMEVVLWHVPNHVIPTIHYYELAKHKELYSTGQFAMLNDFLYRVYWSTEYVINVDLDEFIVPRDGSKNFRQLLNTLPTSCEYRFRNSLVPMNNGPTNKDYIGKDLATKYRLKTLQFTKRQEYIYKTRKTKYIARTNCSTVLWLHYVGEKRPPYTEVAFSRNSAKSTIDVKPTSSIVFHYRMPFEDPVFRRDSRDFDDGSLRPFAKEIMKRVKTVWETIQ